MERTKLPQNLVTKFDKNVIFIFKDR